MADAHTLINVLQSFGEHKILLVGESILDCYLKGDAGGMCREAPVPVVTLRARREAPGGAANTACNMRSLGAQVRFVSVVGDDDEGRRLRAALASQAVDIEGVLVDTARRTVIKQRLRCDDQLVARFDDGNIEPLCKKTAERLADALRQAAVGCDAVVVSDYDLGLMTGPVLVALAELCAQGLPLIADAKRLERYRFLHPWLVKPNFGEALRLLATSAIPQDRAAFMLEAGPALLQVTGARSVVVTLDSDGALLLGPEGPYRTTGRTIPAAFAAGAGDTFLSALTLALTSGADLPAAMELAAAAADLILDDETTVSCNREALSRELAGQGKLLRDPQHIEEVVAHYRAAGRRIVFTNGCFDILHRGHITYLERAKALGDVLVVGLNADASVSRLKGPDRPLNTLADRIAVVAALGCVDHVLSFDDDTAHAPIRLISPDLFVKGGDYASKTLPEVALVEELGGRVRLLEYVENGSTSGLIERIRRDSRTG